MNTPHEHACSVLRGNVSLASITGAITAYNAELLGELDRLRAENQWLAREAERGIHSAEELNRRVDVENALLQSAAGARPLPDAAECRRLALHLGIPDDARRAGR